MNVSSQATGTAYFSLGRPAVYRAGDGLQLAGRVCRRARTTRLSPSRVRMEHLDATGAVIGQVHVYVPAIYRRSDQACANYSKIVKWTLADGDTVRACFDHGAACPAAAETKAVIAAPAGPVATPTQASPTP